MAELVYQTWERITGRPWSDAAKGGFTTGSAADNIALQQRLLGGWNPYASGSAASTASTSTTSAPEPGTVFRVGSSPKVYLMGYDGLAHWITSRTTFEAMDFDYSNVGHISSLAGAGISVGTKITEPPTPGPVPVDPGLAAQQWEAQLALQKQIADDARAQWEEAQADIRRSMEAQLGANPADYVAYELYKRSLVEQGFTPEGTIQTDEEIQEEIDAALGLNTGASAGIGRFGVNIPATQSVSRSELLSFNATDIDVLSSFLRGGVDTGEGEFQGINPADYFQELEEGLVPILPTQRTQFVF